MRHSAVVPAVLALCLFSACPALAAEPRPGTTAPSAAPKTADVLEYIRLFGYSQMLEAVAERQLAVVIELVRQAQEDVEPEVLELIHKELRAELKPASEDAVREMVGVFQRQLTREDVAYLVSVGRDPRMQKVVRLQHTLSADMEAIGDRLAEAVTARATPRIEARLNRLKGGQQL